MRLLLLVWLSLMAPVASAEAPLRLSDFAYGMTLQAEAASALYRVELPEEVYRRVTRADLGDLRIFNAAGEVVPHVLPPPAREAQPPRLVGLPFFPLFAAPDRQGSETTLRIAPDQQGALIDLQVRGGERPGGALLTHYLLDASALREPIRRLQLKWRAGSEPFVAHVTVEASDDLSQWRSVGGGTLADLFHGDHHLQRDELSFAGLAAKYLRISWPPGEKPVALSGVEAEIAPLDREDPLRWTSAESGSSDGAAGRYRFVANGYLPVERLEVVLPQQNTVIKARISSAPDADGNYRQQHFQGVIYALQQEGQILASGPLVIERTAHRYWQLEVDPQSGGVGSGQPQLKLGWRAQQLIFVARGNGPFTLAFGSISAQALPVDSSLQGMIAALGNGNDQSSMVRPVVAQAVRTLGGAQRLQSPPPPLPWKKWLLWAVLVLGVAAMLLMARGLYREMNRGKNGV